MPAFEPIVPVPLRKLYTQRAHSPGARVGSFLLISGMLGRDENLEVIADPEAQMTRAFENIAMVLDEAGCGWSDIAELTAYFTHLRRDFDLFIRVRSSFIGEPHPAMTMIGIAELTHPDLICEVSGIAVMPGTSSQA